MAKLNKEYILTLNPKEAEAVHLLLSELSDDFMRDYGLTENDILAIHEIVNLLPQRELLEDEDGVMRTQEQIDQLARMASGEARRAKSDDDDIFSAYTNAEFKW